MQPSGSAIEGIKLLKGEAISVQVNSPSFWKNKKETQIPVDQIFFYDYFKRKDESERKSNADERGNDAEEDDTDGALSLVEASDNDDALSLVEASDNDDLIPLDEMPDDVIAYDGSLSESEDGGEWEGIENNNQKRKRADDKGTSPKKKRRSLPTFVSYEDYAKMIEDGPENNI